MNVERLNLAMRNAIGINKAEGRTMHIVPEKPMQIAPSRYNLKTANGIAKFTLFEDRLDVRFLKRNSNHKLVEQAKLKFVGSADLATEVFAALFKCLKRL